MKIPKGMRLMPDGNLGAEIQMDDLGYYLITPASIREVAWNNMVISGPGLDIKYMPTSKELEIILDMVQYAVRMGQLIDFGYWPNDMIMNTGHRAGGLYAEDALGHPFSTPYILLHTWDDTKMHSFVEEHGDKKSSCAYLINPFPGRSGPKELCIDFEATCLEGMTIPKHGGIKCLGVGDRAILIGDETRRSKTYACHVVPYALRWKPIWEDDHFKRMATNRLGDDMITAAAGNVMDPVMTALLMLNTRGVGQEVVPAPDKLNKARAKSNKPPIPPYRKVDSASYVTAIMNRVNRLRGPGTGTHASPIMHMRQGHWRHYATGERSFIHDTLVNATPEQRQTFVMGRSHYTVKE